MALVESETKASTPSSPSSRKRASSIGAPSTGSSSNFQSPLWTTRPRGVRMAMEFGSGIECATLMYSMPNGPTVNGFPGRTMVTGMRCEPGSLASLAASRPAAKGVA
jgi:hypothetical protein